MVGGFFNFIYMHLQGKNGGALNDGHAIYFLAGTHTVGFGASYWSERVVRTCFL